MCAGRRFTRKIETTVRYTRDKKIPLGYDVQPLRLAFDSAIDAAAIFRRALYHLNIDCEEIEDVAALRRLFERTIKPQQKLSDADLLELADYVPKHGSMASDSMRNSEGKMITSAMARRIRDDLREDAEAREAVSAALGSNSRALAQDSAAEIYGFALDQMKVDHKGVEGVPALRALFNLARNLSPRRQAFDSSVVRGIAEKFPNAMREIRVL